MATPTYLQWPSMGQGGGQARRRACRWDSTEMEPLSPDACGRDAGKVLGNVARKVLDNRSVPHPLLDAR